MTSVGRSSVMMPRAYSSASSGMLRSQRGAAGSMQLARTSAIETEFDRGGDQARDQARAKRQLHVEQELEAPSAQGGAQPRQFPERCALIEGDKLDFRENRRHQLGFEFADDPGEASVRPRRLESSKRREGMAGIADSRKTQQAHMLQRRFEV